MKKSDDKNKEDEGIKDAHNNQDTERDLHAK
jgi:hypothetical protein